MVPLDGANIEIAEEVGVFYSFYFFNLLTILFIKTLGRRKQRL